MTSERPIASGIFSRPKGESGPIVLVHGGAWNIPADEWNAHGDGLKKALQRVRASLEQGSTAVEAASDAVASMEAHGAFDAGYGAVLNREGFVELDAGIMDGASLGFGSVAGIRNYPQPIRIAQRVMERGERQFCFLSWPAAEAFARAQGFEAVDPASLICERERIRYELLGGRGAYHTSHPFLADEHPKGTVGCVVLDGSGRLAAATSTGGTPMRPAGRVGDSPLPGCGYYANDFAAASATGWGEAIASVVLCKDAVDRLKHGSTLREAAQAALNEMRLSVRNRDDEGATGGIILLDREGRGAWAYSTPVMARGGWTGENIWTAV